MQSKQKIEMTYESASARELTNAELNQAAGGALGSMHSDDQFAGSVASSFIDDGSMEKVWEGVIPN